MMKLLTIGYGGCKPDELISLLVVGKKGKMGKFSCIYLRLDFV